MIQNKLPEDSPRVYDCDTFISLYYSDPSGNSEQNLASQFNKWMKEAFDIIPQSQFGLEIGCGPVVTLSAFSSRKISNLIMTEYNTSCFPYIQDFVKNGSTGQITNWEKHLKLIGELQGNSPKNIEERLQKSIFSCQKIDLTREQVFEYPFFRKVDVITSSLCIETVATTCEQFKKIIQNLTKYLKTGGYLFLIGVLEETFYMVGQKKLPCFAVKEEHLNEAMFENGFQIVYLKVQRPQNPPTQTSDFKGIFSLLARLKK